MSGHSKWASIKHKKAITDSRRGKLFSKVIKEITVAARLGGGDPDSNPRLRTAMQTAKGANMPADNIDRAIKKGTGELPGMTIEEITYEGYGPGGAAILVEVTTDNKNRTVSEIRTILGKNGGNMGETGCVNWMFSKKGMIVIPSDQIGETELMDIVLDAGAEDLGTQDDTYVVTTSMEDFEAVKHAVDQKELKPTVAQITMIPQSTVALTEDKGRQMLRLMEALEDQDDVQNVYANFDIPDELMESLVG